MAALFDWDPAKDVAHSVQEERYYCFGLVEGQILTVRFTYRANVIRIIGAGFWRMGRRAYEAKQGLHGRADRPDPDH